MAQPVHGRHVQRTPHQGPCLQECERCDRRGLGHWRVRVRAALAEAAGFHRGSRCSYPTVTAKSVKRLPRRLTRTAELWRSVATPPHWSKLWEATGRS